MVVSDILGSYVGGEFITSILDGCDPRYYPITESFYKLVLGQYKTQCICM